jgi:hypothetical protein
MIPSAVMIGESDGNLGQVYAIRAGLFAIKFARSLIASALIAAAPRSRRARATQRVIHS